MDILIASARQVLRHSALVRMRKLALDIITGTTAIHRRTFEAARFPKDSIERQRLNRSARTSEYYPSKRYLVIDSAGYTHLAVTRAVAEIVAEDLQARGL